jgi:hypothetical protein
VIGESFSQFKQDSRYIIGELLVLYLRGGPGEPILETVFIEKIHERCLQNAECVGI